MASIGLFVASSLLMALGTRGRNFAASDKSVFHGFENIHFNYYCPVKVFLMIKIRLKPSCRISASFVTLLVKKNL